MKNLDSTIVILLSLMQVNANCGNARTRFYLGDYLDAFGLIVQMHELQMNCAGLMRHVIRHVRNKD